MNSRGKRMNILLSTIDPFFPQWLQSKIGSQNVQVHVLGYLSYEESRLFFTERVTQLGLHNDPAINFDALYEIVGGDTYLMGSLLEWYRRGIPLKSSPHVHLGLMKMSKFAVVNKGDVVDCEYPSSFQCDPVVGWERRLLIELYKEIATHGYARYSAYQCKENELKSIFEHGLLYYYPRKPINESKNKGVLDEPLIVPSTPLERYCIREVLREL